jgi:integrase
MSVLLDKKTNRLFIKFNFQGKTYKKRLPKEMTKKEAEKIEVAFKNKLFFEANGIVPKKDIIFEDFLSDYFLPFAIKHYTEDSYENVKIICKCLLKFVKGISMRRITAAEIERFKNFRQNLKTKHGTERKPATVIRELGVVSKIFSFAIKNEFLEFNPCRRVEKPVFDNLQDDVLPIDRIAVFLESFESKWGRDIAVLILNTGLRQNDALNLKKFNVDWNRGVIKLLQGKTKRKVEIPMNSTVQALLRSRLRNGHELFFPSPKTGQAGKSIKKALKGACDRAKIPVVGARTLRRTFGTMLDELNYNESTVAKLLGHTDLRSVHRYKRGKDILREAVESLESGNCANSVPAGEKPGLRLVVNN